MYGLIGIVLRRETGARSALAEHRAKDGNSPPEAKKPQMRLQTADKPMPDKV